MSACINDLYALALYIGKHTYNMFCLLRYFAEEFIIKLLFALVLLVFSSLASAADSSLQLTDKELAWIKANPEVTVANELDWPPFDYVENGKPAGYSIDVVRLIEQKTGIKVKFINGYTWKELMKKFQAGQIDLMPAIYVNDERRNYILFTKSYYSQPSVMVVNSNNKDISGVNSLEGKRVAGIKGFSITSTLQKTVANVKIVPVNNILEGLKAVSLGDADAFIDSIGTVSYTLENNYIPNIKIISKVDNAELANPPLHIGVTKDKQILRDIIDKALAAVSRDEKRELSNRWFHIQGAVKKQALLKIMDLSSEQQAWLLQHPKIRIGIMNAWPPMDYVDNNGKPQGIGVEFIEALNKRLGGRLEIVPGAWKKTYKAVQEKQLDALMDITPRADRETFFNFTKPYIKVPHLIYTRKGETPKVSLSDLNGQTVGVEKGFFIAKVLRDKYPRVRVREYLTTSDALDALSKGESDAYIGSRAVANYIIENELITNIIAQGKITETSSINAIGVRKDWPVFRDILQKGLDDISLKERSKIINPKAQRNDLSETKSKLYKKLTKAERAWLNNHPSIRLGVDTGWPPVEWIDKEGNYQGMTSDYIKLITEMLGLKVTKPEALAWTEVLRRAKQKKLDVLPAAVSTPERQEFLNFTKPYLDFPFVIFTRDDAPFVTDLQDLYGNRVGVEEGYSSHENLKRDHPKLHLVTFKTTKDILHALSVGEIDAYVGNLTVAVYLINKEGLTNVKVAAPTTYSFALSIAVRKDWPELQSIIEKSLSMIDEVQRNEIRQRWLKLNYKVGVDYALVIKAAIIVSIIIVLIFLWMFYIQSQKRKLSAAKTETDALNASFVILNNELLEANVKLKEMDRMKSMFVASISHELRTPLNSIIGFSSMMVEGAFGELNEKYQDYVSRINKSGKHLLKLITDIIDISKIEAGRVDVVLDDFEISEIVSEAVSALSQQIEQKGLSLEVKVPAGITMHTDRLRLYQCLLNLLSNAMKYTEKGGIRLMVEPHGQEVYLNVHDTGIGISETDLPRLFEAFERMESHLQVKAGGTGLGLYLTNKIATELLQGEVGVESKQGEGSTFWIKVPKRITVENSTEFEEDL